MKKIISIFAVVLVFVFSALPCFAVEYSTDFPSYVPISGGAFFEVKSSLGQITFVCPNNFKNGYFGFSGNGNNSKIIDIKEKISNRSEKGHRDYWLQINYIILIVLCQQV